MTVEPFDGLQIEGEAWDSEDRELSYVVGIGVDGRGTVTFRRMDGHLVASGTVQVSESECAGMVRAWQSLHLAMKQRRQG
ncbi:hypothetical protein [Actinophytocola sediminis]